MTANSPHGEKCRLHLTQKVAAKYHGVLVGATVAFDNQNKLKQIESIYLFHTLVNQLENSINTAHD